MTVFQSMTLPKIKIIDYISCKRKKNCIANDYLKNNNFWNAGKAQG